MKVKRHVSSKRRARANNKSRERDLTCETCRSQLPWAILLSVSHLALLEKLITRLHFCIFIVIARVIRQLNDVPVELNKLIDVRRMKVSMLDSVVFV